MRLISAPARLFPDALDWESLSTGVWSCTYQGIQMFIIDRFDDEPPGFSAQWSIDEDGEPLIENEDVQSLKEAIQWLRDQFDPAQRDKPVRYAPRIVLYGFDLQKWMSKWGLDPIDPIPCPKCGTPRAPTLPYLQGSLRGVLSEPCSCGNKSNAPYSFVTTHGGLPHANDF